MIDIIDFSLEDLVLTAEVRPSGDGYTSDWWASSSLGDVPTACGHLNLPVFGDTEAMAKQRLQFMSEDVLHFLYSNWGGQGIPEGKPANLNHVYLHMQIHAKADKMQYLSELEKTVAIYQLLSSFRVNEPAPMIAECLDVNSVRTVHDRIARARKDGLLPSFGQGRSHVAV